MAGLYDLHPDAGEQVIRRTALFENGLGRDGGRSPQMDLRSH